MNGGAPEVAAPSADTQKEAAVANREPRQIVVERGQSLSRIAAKYGMRRRAIIAANNLTPPYKIKIGQHLLIPGEDESSPTPPASAAAASAVPEIIPLDSPARAGSAAPPPTAPPAMASASAGSPPAAPAVTSVALAAPAENKNPEPPPAPAVSAMAATGAPSAPTEPPVPAATAPAPAPAEAASAPASAAAAAPPGVTCPFGTTGMWSEDVIKKPVYICRRPPSQG